MMIPITMDVVVVVGIPVGSLLLRWLMLSGGEEGVDRGNDGRC